jgi:Tetracyclin repressor-like, C-terminal domain
LRALGRTYIQFASDYPLHYRLMFMQRSEMLRQNAPKGYEHLIDSFGLLKKAVALMLETGAWKDCEVETTAALLWTAVHGAASLELSSQLQPVQAVNLVKWHFELIFEGLKK